MDILIVGRWILLALGVIAVLVGLFIIAKPPAKRTAHPLWPLVFGGLFLGMGVFGLEFIPQYRLWLESLTNLVEKSDAKSYEAFFAKVGSQKIPPAIQEIGVNYAVANPVKEMDAVLTRSIAKAPDNTEGKKALLWAKESYEGKQREINHLVTSKVNIDSVKSFAPVTIRLMRDKIKALPDSEKKQLGIDTNTIKKYDGLIQAFPGNKRSP